MRNSSAWRRRGRDDQPRFETKAFLAAAALFLATIATLLVYAIAPV